MERLTKIVIEEYKYGSEEEREKHVKEIEIEGYYCTGQAKKRDDSLHLYYWYGKFIKEIR